MELIEEINYLLKLSHGEIYKMINDNPVQQEFRIPADRDRLLYLLEKYFLKMESIKGDE